MIDLTTNEPEHSTQLKRYPYFDTDTLISHYITVYTVVLRSSLRRKNICLNVKKQPCHKTAVNEIQVTISNLSLHIEKLCHLDKMYFYCHDVKYEYINKMRTDFQSVFDATRNINPVSSVPTAQHYWRTRTDSPAHWALSVWQTGCESHECARLSP